MTKQSIAARTRKRRLVTLIWIVSLSLITIFLIYREMTALLYILATLGVTALLVVVALADLSPSEQSSRNLPPSS